MELFASLPEEVGVVTSHRIIYGRNEKYVFGADKVCVAPDLRKVMSRTDQVGYMLDDNRLVLPCGLFRRNLLPTTDWFDVCAKANEDWNEFLKASANNDHTELLLNMNSLTADLKILEIEINK